jgi:hypothetical protein
MWTMWSDTSRPTASPTICQTSMPWHRVAGELMRVAQKIDADLFVTGG